MDTATLTRMANDIAINLAAQGREAAVTATAQHIRDYWAPRMIAAIPTLPRAALHPIAAAAMDMLGADSGRAATK